MLKKLESYDRTGRPVVCNSSNTRQLGCVFQDMEPPKSSSNLRKSSDIRKPIRRVKFTKAVARHADIRDQNPSLGLICPGEHHQRSANAPKFEDRSLEETEWLAKSVWARRPLHHRGSCRIHPGVLGRATVPWWLRLRWRHLGKTLLNACRRRADHSEEEGLSSCLSSSVNHDRTVRPIVCSLVSSAQETQRHNSESEQIRTLLERQREQILADCQAEIRKHEFQAD